MSFHRHRYTLIAAGLAGCVQINGALADAAHDHNHHRAASTAGARTPAAAADHPHDVMDHTPSANAQPPGSGDHGTTDHSAHTGTAGPIPVPPLTDVDRRAAYFDAPGHAVHDRDINWLLVLDQLEWQDADHGNALSWNVTGWLGGDIDRLWLRSEGERNDGVTEAAELQLLWGHAIGPWWDVVAGVRQDFKPGAAQTWGAVGLQGLALYGFEAEASVFIGENGQTALRLGGEYDLLITNRLILQPSAEMNVYGKNDNARAVGSGLSDVELGLRLRYEIRREFAPYIGISWHRAYGNSADLIREAGESVTETRLVVGLRLWF